MNPVARRRTKPAANLIDADEAKRRAALDLSIAMRKAQRDKDQAVDTALTELANALGFDVVISIEPDA